MNKMIFNKKSFLTIGIVLAIVMFFALGQASAAVSYQPVQANQPMAVNLTSTINQPLVQTNNMILIDNFEYWESPLNQGWHANEPAYPGGYPVWGMNIGAGMLSTVIDFQEGSRVLEVYYPSNVFVPNMEKYSVNYNIGVALSPAYSVLNIKMRAPVSIESFDSFEIIVVCNGGAVEVHLTPRAGANCGANCPVTVPEATAALNNGLVAVHPNNNPAIVEVKIGREAEDGSWHLIRVDLNHANIFAGALASVDEIVIRGNEFRADDIKLMTAAANARTGKDLYMFHINHVFTQIFDPVGYSRMIFASDPVVDAVLPAGGNMGNTAVMARLNNVSLAEANFAFWANSAAGFINGLDPLMDINLYNTAINNFQQANQISIADIRREAIRQGGGAITIGLGDPAVNVNIQVDARLVYPLDTPMLLDPVMSEGPFATDGGVNYLSFTAFVGGAHELGTGANLTHGLLLHQNQAGTVQNAIYQAMPYIPLYKMASTESGNPYLTAQQASEIAASLYYGGYNTWPNAAILNIPSQQIVENMAVTVVCSDGLTEDVESFMIETVNYPVTNTPPVIEDIDDQIFYVEEGAQTYQLNATDADSFTLSSAVQFENDIAQLVWTASLQGYPAYQYGPFTDSLIDQKTGLVNFDPISEGVYDMVVSVRDPKGAQAYGAFTIYCVNKATWLNHPPVMLRDWEHPMIGTQGAELVLALDQIVDPDGEPLYYSCNIGSIGYVNGNATWTFQTEYPGTYLVEIAAYDTSGGYIVIPQEIVITSWWSN